MAGKGKNFNPQGVLLGPKPPCGKAGECTDRKPGCAINCEKWAAYVAERNANYAKRLKDGENNSQSEENRVKRNRHIYHQKNRGK